MINFTGAASNSAPHNGSYESGPRSPYINPRSPFLSFISFILFRNRITMMPRKLSVARRSDSWLSSSVVQQTAVITGFGRWLSRSRKNNLQTCSDRRNDVFCRPIKLDKKIEFGGVFRSVFPRGCCCFPSSYVNWRSDKCFSVRSR